jgi:hypothetical protein
MDGEAIHGLERRARSLSYARDFVERSMGLANDLSLLPKGHFIVSPEFKTIEELLKTLSLSYKDDLATKPVEGNCIHRRGGSL